LKKFDARETFATSPEIIEEIKSWRKILKTKPYNSLPLADRGDIDYFIQTKILKWNEVERERRMRDPIFNYQFEKLREQLFPLDPVLAKAQEAEEKASLKAKVEDKMIFDTSFVQTNSPFYYEDYYIVFNRFRDRPYLSKWNDRARQNLSRWVVDTLAFQSELKVSERDGTSQLYLDLLSETFFPMLKYPQNATSYQLPPPEKIREILYKNGIGYKTDDRKLYIKRFYLLPRLLFPKETIETTEENNEKYAIFILLLICCNNISSNLIVP